MNLQRHQLEVKSHLVTKIQGKCDVRRLHKGKLSIYCLLKHLLQYSGFYSVILSFTSSKDILYTSIEYASSCKIRYSLPENFLISSYNKETINTYELERQRVKND